VAVAAGTAAEAQEGGAVVAEREVGPVAIVRVVVAERDMDWQDGGQMDDVEGEVEQDMTASVPSAARVVADNRMLDQAARTLAVVGPALVGAVGSAPRATGGKATGAAGDSLADKSSARGSSVSVPSLEFA
jgi:hypothetical protein